MAEQAVLGLGSNQGQREDLLRQAVAGLGKAQGLQLVAASSVYESAPLDVPSPQQDYLNQVLVVDVEVSARRLLSICQSIEEALGRPRNRPWRAPRTIDIDLITCGSLLCSTPELELPHPRYTGRMFVLVPLREVLPSFSDPLTGLSVQQLLNSCPDRSELHLWNAVSEAL